MLVYDHVRPTKGHLRTKEYLFLVLTGVVGAVYGFINDLFTAKISPEYFWLGKGLENGPKLYIDSIVLGAEAGFSAGIILGCIFLFCRTYLFKNVSFKKMILSLAVPIAGGIVLAFIFSCVLQNFDPYNYSEELDGVFSQEQLYSFLFVWREHLGSYVGAIGGTILIVIYHIISNKSKS